MERNRSRVNRLTPEFQVGNITVGKHPVSQCFEDRPEIAAAGTAPENIVPGLVSEQEPGMVRVKPLVVVLVTDYLGFPDKKTEMQSAC